MPNPFEIETLTVQYTPALEMLLQQTTSKLRGLVNEGSHTGSAQASPVQQIGPVEFKAPVGRYAPLVFQVPNYTRRWVFPNDREVPLPVDTFDLLKTIVDPKSALSQSVVAACNRFIDDTIIAAFFATAYIGVSGTGTESWPASTYVVADTFDSASTVGITVAKLIEGRRILEHYQNDLDADPPTIVVGSQGNSDLMKQIEVIDMDMNLQAEISGGKVRKILGVNVVHSERLSTTTVSANTVRQCPMFVKSGMHLGVWKEIDIRISQETQLSGQPWQLYAMASFGATRMQLGKVIEVRGYDTTGTDPTAP